MSGPIGYVLGYDAGRSDAEISRQRREIVDRIFYGTRNVEVDQSYIDRLHAALAAANASSDHNYDAADRFRNEAFEWKAYAQSQENLVAPLRAQISALQAHSPSATPPSDRLTRRLLRSGPRIKRRTK